MATPGRTQKQIAERYKGNLGYYKRKHPWRVARWCASLLAIAGGIAGIILFRNAGTKNFSAQEKFRAVTRPSRRIARSVTTSLRRSAIASRWQNLRAS